MPSPNLEESRSAVQSESDWRVSRDPVGMLFWLATLHPAPHVDACVSVGQQVASLPATAFLASEQRDWLEGRRYNGRSVFHFWTLAGLMRGVLRRESLAGDSSALAAQIADALRHAIPSPEALRARQ